MPSFAMYVTQDGADFYVHSDPDLTVLEPSLCRTAPFPVRDTREASRARKWFRDLNSKNQAIHWPNPFAPDVSQHAYCHGCNSYYDKFCACPSVED